MLQEGVYPYEYMNDCEKFNGISLIEKEDFYSHLNMEDITDVDYTHAKRVCKDSEIKQLRIISWLACSEWYFIVSWKLWKYVSWNIWPWSCWISMANSFEKDLSKIRSFDWDRYVINGRKEWEEEYITLFIDMQKLITSTWKIMIKIKNRYIFNIGM